MKAPRFTMVVQLRRSDIAIVYDWAHNLGQLYSIFQAEAGNPQTTFYSYAEAISPLCTTDSFLGTLHMDHGPKTAKPIWRHDPRYNNVIFIFHGAQADARARIIFRMFGLH